MHQRLQREALPDVEHIQAIGDQRQQEVGLIEEAERRQPSASAAARTLVKSTCAVSPGRRAAAATPSRTLRARRAMLREGRQRAGRVRRRIEFARLVAVVDQDDEAAPQAPRGVADPVHRAQIDLDAPAGFERHAERGEIVGRRRRRRGPRSAVAGPSVVTRARRRPRAARPRASRPGAPASRRAARWRSARLRTTRAAWQTEEARRSATSPSVARCAARAAALASTRWRRIAL